MAKRAMMAALAMAVAAGVGTPRLFRAPKPEKYLGQRRSYLIGANCPEGERMRAAKESK